MTTSKMLIYFNSMRVHDRKPFLSWLNNYGYPSLSESWLNNYGYPNPDLNPDLDIFGKMYDLVKTHYKLFDKFLNSRHYDSFPSFLKEAVVNNTKKDFLKSCNLPFFNRDYVSLYNLVSFNKDTFSNFLLFFDNPKDLYK